MSLERPSDEDLRRVLRLLAEMVEEEWPETPWRAAAIWGNAGVPDIPVIEAALAWAGFESDRVPPPQPEEAS